MSAKVVIECVKQVSVDLNIGVKRKGIENGYVDCSGGLCTQGC